MRCSTWRGNDLTKSNRQVQLWVCPRFEPLTPHLCISYTVREPVYLFSFIPSASCRSNSFTILSPTPLRAVETQLGHKLYVVSLSESRAQVVPSSRSIFQETRLLGFFITSEKTLSLMFQARGTGLKWPFWLLKSHTVQQSKY